MTKEEKKIIDRLKKENGKLRQENRILKVTMDKIIDKTDDALICLEHFDVKNSSKMFGNV